MTAPPTRRTTARTPARTPAPPDGPPTGPVAPAHWPCLGVRSEGVWLDVSVQPGARHTAAVGLHDDALRLRLCAPPIDGRANQCLIDWLAEQLGCAKRDVRITRGQTARRKRVELDLDSAAVAAWLARAVPLTSATSPRPSRPAR